MICFIRGTLVRTHADGVVLDVGGLGYDILTPPIVLEDLSGAELGAEIALVTHHYLQIDQNKATPVLLGFREDEEREFYALFAGVVGPKSALKAMAAPLSQIAQSIELGDQGFLKSLPGIGPQKAKEIIARLQGKMARFVGFEIESMVNSAERRDIASDFVSDAIDALTSLDYKRSEAVQTVNRVLRADPSISTVEEILQAAFRQ